jgi:GAF domain-containing protein
VSEHSRLAALHSYGLLDAVRPVVLDDLTRLASRIFDTPMSTVTLVDQDRQWFAGNTGMDGHETPRNISFCAWMIDNPRPLIVDDARGDARFRNYSNVTGAPYIRFYAGVPLINDAGFVLGSVCVIDREPRTIGDRQIAMPVATMQGYLEMLAEEEQLAPYRRLLDPIRRNGDRLVRMVDHLLAGARPDDTPPPREGLADLGDAVRAALATTETLAAKHGVSLTLSTEPEQVYVVGESSALRQAVEHLVRNAILFSSDGATVHVRAIAWRIVTAHGGDLAVTSPGAGHGARARITLPSASPLLPPTNASGFASAAVL